MRGDRARELAALERAAAAGIAPELIAAFPEGHLITRYLDARSWSEAQFARPEVIARVAPLAAIEARRAEALGGTLALCHNDPYFPNVLDDGALKLIDWEFAGMGDPLYDLAASTYPRGEGQKRAMAERYHDDPGPEEAATLDAIIYVCAFWNAVWALGRMGATAIDYDYRVLFDELVEAMARHRPS